MRCASPPESVRSARRASGRRGRRRSGSCRRDAYLRRISPPIDSRRCRAARARRRTRRPHRPTAVADASMSCPPTRTARALRPQPRAVARRASLQDHERLDPLADAFRVGLAVAAHEARDQAFVARLELAFARAVLVAHLDALVGAVEQELALLLGELPNGLVEVDARTRARRWSRRVEDQVPVSAPWLSIAPSRIDFSGSGTRSSRLISRCVPRPLHSRQAP